MKIVIEVEGYKKDLEKILLEIVERIKRRQDDL